MPYTPRYTFPHSKILNTDILLLVCCCCLPTKLKQVYTIACTGLPLPPPVASISLIIAISPLSLRPPDLCSHVLFDVHSYLFPLLFVPPFPTHPSKFSLPISWSTSNLGFKIPYLRANLGFISRIFVSSSIYMSSVYMSSIYMSSYKNSYWGRILSVPTWRISKDFHTVTAHCFYTQIMMPLGLNNLFLYFVL